MDQQLLRQAFEASRDGMIITSGEEDDFRIIYANPAFVRLTGYPLDEILGKNCRFLQGADRQQAVISHIKESLIAGKECHCRIRNYKKNGEAFWNELSLSPIECQGGKASFFVGIQNDVTALVEKEEKIKEEALHDYVSGLLNARGFYLKAEEKVRMVTEGVLFLAMMDINDFKGINDSFGHVIGDEVIKQFSTHLVKANRVSDAMLARVGGDEFIYLSFQSDYSDADFQAMFQEAVRKTRANLIEAINFSVSYGIFSEEAARVDNVRFCVHSADKAMYLAKSQEKEEVL